MPLKIGDRLEWDAVRFSGITAETLYAPIEVLPCVASGLIVSLGQTSAVVRLETGELLEVELRSCRRA